MNANIMRVDNILCLGNGDETADSQAKIVALKHKLQYSGLVDTMIEHPVGCYHTSIYDIPINDLYTLSERFDKIVCLNQGLEMYQTPYDFFIVVKLMHYFDDKKQVEFLNKSHRNDLLKYTTENKSFCLAPFIGLRNDNDDLMPCCWSSKTLVKNTIDFDYVNNKEFNELRSAMLAGELSDVCKECYAFESSGTISPRITYTEEWSFRTGQTSIERVTPELKTFDLKMGNKCNLLCRMCHPGNSNLISNEYHKIGLVSETLDIQNGCAISSIALESINRLYIAGGEPLINDRLTEILDKCIELNRANLEIIINTNAAAIPQQVYELMSQFSNIKFEISIDGFDKVNHYIRWPSNWDKILDNVETLNKISKKKISFNTAVSIYNVANLYDLLKFTEERFPWAEHHISYVFTPVMLQPWKTPIKQKALIDLNRVKTLNRYNGHIFKSRIDGLITRIEQHSASLEEADEFFKWNDLLDKSRNIKLTDFIPELCQESITKLI